MNHGPVRLQGRPGVVMPALPGVAFLAPIDRMFRFRAGAPAPALVVPASLFAIAPLIHEAGEFGLGHRGAGHAEGGHGDRMAPFLVVEGEGLIPGRAQQELAAWNLHIAFQRPGAGQAGCHGSGRRIAAQGRRGIAQGLAGVGEGLVVHVLVVDGQQVQIGLPGIGGGVAKPRQGRVHHPVHVGPGPLPVRQGSAPAVVVVDHERVEQRVAVFDQRGTARIKQAQNEGLVKIAHVTHLPQGRVDHVQPGHLPLRVVQGVHQEPGAPAGVLHQGGQLTGGHGEIGVQGKCSRVELRDDGIGQPGF